MWNLWHGCHKLSEGCRHCYVYRTDGKYGKDSSVVTKTEKFDLPLQRKKNGTYKIPSGNLVKRRKIKHFCIITACILIFAALLIYSIRRIYWFYLFQDGYAIETMYDGTDVPGPEEIGITNYRTYQQRRFTIRFQQNT